MQMLHKKHTRFKTTSTVECFFSEDRETKEKKSYYVVCYICVAWIRLEKKGS